MSCVDGSRSAIGPKSLNQPQVSSWCTRQSVDSIVVIVDANSADPTIRDACAEEEDKEDQVNGLLARRISRKKGMEEEKQHTKAIL